MDIGYEDCEETSRTVSCSGFRLLGKTNREISEITSWTFLPLFLRTVLFIGHRMIQHHAKK